MPGRRRAGLAAQRVPLAVRHEREVAGRERAGSAVAGLEPAPARRDDVEPDVARHRRQRQAPRRAELGAAVEGAVHPQEVQRLAERIRRRPGVELVHAASMHQSAPIVQALDDRA